MKIKNLFVKAFALLAIAMFTSLGLFGQTPLTTAVLSANQNPCGSSASGSATLVLDGDDAPFTYAWTRNGVAYSALPANAPTNLLSGTYVVTVTDASSNVAVSNSIALTNVASLTLSGETQSGTILCNGATTGAISAVISGGGTAARVLTVTNTTTSIAYFTQTPIGGSPAAGFTYEVTGLPAGTYTVVASSTSSSCTSSGSNIIISEPAILSGTVTANITCFGTTGTIVVSSAAGGAGTYEYSKDNGSTWQTSATFSGLAAGTYQVSIRDAVNTACVIDLDATGTSIIQPAILSGTVTPTNVTICNGLSNGSIVVSSAAGGAGTYEYSKDNGSTWQSLATFSGLVAGTYQVSIRDAVNTACVIDLDASGTVISEPIILSGTVTPTNVTICNGLSNGSIVVSSAAGGAGTYEYSKDNGSTWQSLGTFSGLAAGTYQMSIRDAVNTACVIDLDASGTVISEPIILSGTVTANNATCFGTSTGTIVVSSAAGGAGTYEYSKDNGSTWQTSATFSGLAAGTYQVSIRDAVNTACVIDLDATGTSITQPAILSGTVTPTNVTICNGLSNGSIAITSPAGGAGTYEYSKDNGSTWQPLGTFSGLAAGTYQMSIRDAVNTACVIDLDASGTVISEPIILSGTVTATNVTICNGLSNGSIAVSSPAGGAGTYEYSKDNGSTWQSLATFSGLVAGTYQVSIRDAVNTACVIDLDASGTVISEPIILSGTVTPTNVTICNGLSNGSIVVSSAAGGAGTYEYSKDNGSTWQSLGTFSGLAAGTYQMSIRDAVNTACVIDLDASGTVISEPIILSGTVTANNATCFGTSTGTIVVSSAAGGAGTYEYSKDNGSTWQTSATFSGLAAGTYQVSIRDAVNTACVIDLDATGTSITQPAILSGTVTPTNVTICNGLSNGSIAITSPAGGAGTYEYSKDNGSTWQPLGTFSGLAAGTYQMSIRDAVNTACVIDLDASGTVISEPIILSGTVTATNVTICNGLSNGSIAVSSPAGGAGTYEYSKDNGSTWQSLATFSGLAAATYQVSIRDAANTTCVIDLDASGTVISEPIILSGTVTANNATCFGTSTGTIVVSSAAGGAGTYEYSIDNGSTWQTLATFSGLLAGTYQVSIRDAANTTCIIDLDASGTIISEPAALTASITAQTNNVCNGGSIGTATLTPVGGTAPYTYVWSNGATTASISSLAAGTYTVTVTDANSCTTTSSVTITEPTVISISNDGISDAFCSNTNDGAIPITASGGTGAYTYAWTGPNGFTSTNEDQNYNLAPGTYAVTVTDANGCQTTLSNLVVGAPSAVVIALTGTNISCYNLTDGAIAAVVSGGTPAYSFQWTKNTLAYATTQNITGLTAGVYQLTVTDANFCSYVSSTVTITEPAELTATVAANASAVCSGENVLFTLTGTAGEVITYSINSGTNATATIGAGGTTVVTVNAATVDQTIALVSVSDGSCTNVYSGTATTTINALPTPNAGADQTVCNAENVTLTGTGVATLAWDNSVVNGVAFVASNVTSSPVTTTYTLTETDANGCVGTDQVLVTVNPTPTVDAVADEAICVNTATTAVNFTSSFNVSGTTYSWTNNNASIGLAASGTGNISSFTGLNTGTTDALATITVTPSANNCDGTPITFTITVNPTPIIASKTDAICSAGSFTVAPANGSGDIVPTGTTYSWSAPTVAGITGTASGANAASISGTLINTTNSPITVNYSVTPSAFNPTSTCTGAPFTVAVTVNPSPIANAGADQTVCVGASVTLAGTGVDTYTWDNSVVDNIAFTAVNATNASITTTYTMTATDGNGCTSSDQVAVTVEPTPIIANTVDTICSVGTFNVTPANGSGNTVPTGTTYTWSAPTVAGITGTGSGTNATSISGTLTNTTSAPIDVTYTVTPTQGLITVGASFGGGIVGYILQPADPGYVSGQTTALIIASADESGYTLGCPAGGVATSTAFGTGVSNTNTLNNFCAPTIPTTANLASNSVLGGYNDWFVPSKAELINIMPNVSSNLSPGYYGTSSSMGLNDMWCIHPNGSQNFLPNSWGSQSGYVVYFRPVRQAIITSSGCPGAPFTVVVTVNPTPIIAAKTATICSASTFNVAPATGGSDIVPTGTTYTWTVSANANVTGQSDVTTGVSSISQNLVNTTNTAETVTYTVTPTSGTCVGASFSVTVTVNPTPSVIAQTATICSGGSYTYSPSNGGGNIIPVGGPGPGTHYTWSAPIVNGLTGMSSASGYSAGFVSGTLVNTTNAPITVVYTVTPNYDNTPVYCAGSPFTVTITVDPTPTIAAQTATICSASAFNVAPTTGGTDIVPTGTTYTWTVSANANVTGQSDVTIGVSSISQTLVNTTNTAETVTYTVTPTSGSCVGASFAVTVTVDPTPTIATQTATVCSGGLFTVTPSNGTDIVPSGTTYAWSAPSVTGITGTASGSTATSITGTLTNTTNAAIVVNYIVTPTSGICAGVTFNVAVTVEPTPSIDDVSLVVCSGNAATNTPANGGGVNSTDIVPSGTSYTWSAPTVAGITGMSSGSSASSFTSGTLVNTTNAPINVTYTVTPSQGAPVLGSVFGGGQIAYVFQPTDLGYVPGQTTVLIAGTTNYSGVIGNCAPPTSYVATSTAIGTGAANTQYLVNNCSLTTTGVYIADTLTTGGYTDWYLPSKDELIKVLQNSWITPSLIFTGQYASSSVINENNQGISYFIWMYYYLGVNNTPVVMSPQQFPYRMRPVRTGTIYSVVCSGAPYNVTVTVNPKPSIVAKTTTICTAGSFAVAPTNGSGDIVPTGTTYSWSAPTVAGITGTASGSSATSITGTLTNTTNAAIVVNYMVTPTSGTCVGAAFSLAVTVNPVPSVIAQTAASCSGSTFTLAPTNGSGNIVPTGTTYSWTAPSVSGITGTASGTNAASISGTLTNTTSGPITVNYTVTPNVDVSAIGSLYGGGIVTYILGPADPNYVPGQTTALITAPNDQSTAAPWGCYNTFITSSGTYNPATEFIGAGVQNTIEIESGCTTSGTAADICANLALGGYTDWFLPSRQELGKMYNNIGYAALGLGNIAGFSPVYYWSSSEFNSQVAIGWNFSAGGNGGVNKTNTKYVRAARWAILPSACAGAPFTVSVTVNPTPAIANATVNACSGTAYTVAPVNGAGDIVPTGTTYTWTVVDNPFILGETNQASAQSQLSETLINLYTTPQTVVYAVTPTSGSCVGTPFTVTATVNTVPLVSSITGASNVCEGLSTTLASSTTGGTWSSSNTAIATVSATGVVTGVAAGSATITYSVTNVAGCTASATASVTVNPSASATIASGGATTFCSGGSVVLTANSGSSYLWSNGLQTQSITATTSGSYTVTVTNASGCSATSVATPVTVNALPVVAAITGSSNVCTGSTTTLASSTTGGTWSSSNNAVATVSTTGVVSGVTSGLVTITYSVTNASGCTTSTTASVTVNPSASATIAAGGATTFCAGGSVVLTASTGSTYLWSNGLQTQSITATTSGSYTVTVTNASGCSATSTATAVTVDPTPVVAAITGASNVCEGLSTTLASSTTGGTWSSSNTAIATVSATGVVTGVAAGSATITYSVTNVSGCSASTTASVTVNPSASATIAAGGATTFCAGGSVVLTASSGSTYLWSNGLQTQSITATTSGSYTVTVTNASGCSATSVATPVTVNALPVVAAITGSSNVCTGSTTTLASSSTGGTWSSSNTAIATVSATGVVSGVTSGLVTITYSVTNASGCTTSTTASVTVNPSASATIASGGATTFCAGGSVVLTASSGSSYLWSNGLQTQSITATTSGSYTVTVTNASGCSATSTATAVTVDPTPVVAAITGASNVCEGLSTTLASSTTGGTWSSSNTAIATVSATGVVTGVAAGSATITYSVTNVSGCSASTSASMTVNAGATASITTGGATTFCSGGSVVLTANAGSTYLWSNGLQTQSITATTSGSYTVTVTNASGCSATSVATPVTVNALPVVAAITGSSNVCTGSTTTLASSTTGGTWSSSNNAVATVSTTGVVSGVTSGLVTITYSVTNASGCTTSTTASVTVNPSASATIAAGGATTFCAGGSVVLTASTGSTYLWSNGLQTQSITAATSGSYTVTVTNASGCSATSTATAVTVDPTPVVAAITGASNVCEGLSTTLASSTTGGTWSSSNTAIATVSATGVVTGVAAGSATITYSVTNVSGCSASTTASVTVNPSASATIAAGGATTFCTGGSVVLTANAGSTYLWSNGLQTQSITATTSGSYTVTVTNASGCSATSVATPVTVNALPVVAAITGSSNVCTGSTTTLASSTTGGTWSSSNNAVATVSTTGVVSGVTSGLVTITYSVTNASGCTTSTTASVTVNPSASATIAAGGATTFCAGGSVVLTASTGSTYLWSNGLQTQSITATTSGSYTVTNASGCSATSTAIVVTVNPLPVVAAITGASNVCEGLSTTLASSTTGGTWSSSNNAVATVSTTGVVTGVAAGSATITYSVTNVAGCTASATASMTVNSLPTATITPGGATTFCTGGSVVLTANAGSTYLWSNGLQTQSITATTSGSYTVTVTNTSGCSATSVATPVTVNTLPVVAAITGSSNVCTGSTTTLASSTTGGTWSSSNNAVATVSTTGVVTGVAAGSVTIAYSLTNAAGCTASATASVTVNPSATATIAVSGSTMLCTGGSVVLTASTGSTYLWSNGAQTQSITVIAAGSYFVTVTNASGCSLTSQATVVTVNPLPIVAAITGSSNVCGGSTTTLASSTTGGTWSSSNTAIATVSTTGVVTGVAAGSATITYSVTNAAGCTASTTASVTVNPSATATITPGGPTTFCAGGSVVLTASTGSTYLWSNGLQTQSITATTSGSYSVTVTIASGCSVTSVATPVTVNALPVVAAITGTPNVCAGSTTTLASSTTGGTWSSSNNAVATVNASGAVTGVTAGLVTITYTVTNASGCVNTSTASVTVNALPTLPVISANGPVTICPSSNVILTSSTGFTYTWSTGDQTASIIVSQAGSYYVTVSNANGCTSQSAPINVVVIDTTAPVLVVPNDLTASTNTSCEAVVDIGNALATDNCGMLSITNDAPSLFPIGTTTVTWTATDASGNITVLTQLITVVDDIDPTILVPVGVIAYASTSCEAANVDLGTPTASDNCPAGLVVTNDAPATYPIGVTVVVWTVTDASGNSVTASQNVTVYDTISPTILATDYELTLNQNGQAIIDFIDLDTGSYDNCGIATVTLSQYIFDCDNVGDNEITIVITDNNGNTSSMVVNVFVNASLACGGDTWSGPTIPQAFTPNGNNINDVFEIPGLEGYDMKELYVYDRYGGLVYDSKDYQNNWDGTNSSGEQLPDATYYYLLRVTGGKEKAGYVYINRVQQ